MSYVFDIMCDEWCTLDSCLLFRKSYLNALALHPIWKNTVQAPPNRPLHRNQASYHSFVALMVGSFLESKSMAMYAHIAFGEFKHMIADNILSTVILSGATVLY